VLVSNVSSPMLGVLAKDLGVHYEETLTGFKWIANRAMTLERERGLRFVFGYEEALGYTAGTVVRDKDGISAAVIFAELAASLRARGSSVMARLEELYRKYGLFVSSQVNMTKKGANGAEQIRALMAGLRASPPRKIGAYDVVAMSDYAAQTRTELRNASVSPLTLPKSNVITFELAGGSRVIARPSGTEPKVKFYFDVREALAAGESLATAEGRAAVSMKALADAFVGGL
jgi:phosphomannomutase